MGKFVAYNLHDGRQCLYETLTGITWRTEYQPYARKDIGLRHSGLAITSSNLLLESAKEGQEMNLYKAYDIRKHMEESRDSPT